MGSFQVPRQLLDAARAEHRESWLATLPNTVNELMERWSLRIGAPFEPGGQTAWVAPAVDRDGRDVVLKVMWRHPEAAHEADGLRAWHGDGTVELFAAQDYDDTIALLVERCVPGTPLAQRPEPEQDVVVAGLLRRLWRQQTSPGHRFRPLQAMCDQWADAFEEKITGRASTIDAGLVRDGVALFRALPATRDRTVLLCTDLHAGNVLAAQREPWLVIDPKPYLGDPTYDALQHLLNCDKRLHADPHGLCRRMAELLELDTDRLIRWLFARCVIESIDWPGLADVAARLAP